MSLYDVLFCVFVTATIILVPISFSFADFLEAKSYFIREQAHKMAIERGKEIKELSLSNIFKRKR